MARLEKEGYFEEEASRKRAPLLHHQYLGQYAPPRAPIKYVLCSKVTPQIE